MSSLFCEPPWQQTPEVLAKTHVLPWVLEHKNSDSEALLIVITPTAWLATVLTEAITKLLATYDALDVLSHRVLCLSNNASQLERQQSCQRFLALSGDRILVLPQTALHFAEIQAVLNHNKFSRQLILTTAWRLSLPVLSMAFKAALPALKTLTILGLPWPQKARERFIERLSQAGLTPARTKINAGISPASRMFQLPNVSIVASEKHVPLKSDTAHTLTILDFTGSPQPHQLAEHWQQRLKKQYPATRQWVLHRDLSPDALRWQWAQIATSPQALVLCWNLSEWSFWQWLSQAAPVEQWAFSKQRWISFRPNPESYQGGLWNWLSPLSGQAPWLQTEIFEIDPAFTTRPKNASPKNQCLAQWLYETGTPSHWPALPGCGHCKICLSEP